MRSRLQRGGSWSIRKGQKEAERNRRKKNSRWRTDTDMKTESRRGKQKANLKVENLRG